MIVRDMPESEYHARPELSSTGVRRLLDSPARFKYWSEHPEPPKQAFDIGTATHSKVLGVGAGAIVYPDEHLTPSGNVSEKAATVAWAAEQRANGLVPIGREEAKRVDAMAEAVLAEPDARKVIEAIIGREVTIVSEVEGVPSRARFDMYDGVRAADLKTARDASPGGFNRGGMAGHGYYIQEQWYRDTHYAETGHELEFFQFIVVESAAPHLVGVYDVDWTYREAARKKTREARERWLECTGTGIWPGYGKKTLLAPTWVVIEDEDEMEAY